MRADPYSPGLTGHKPEDEWEREREKEKERGRRRSRYPPCDCCPYGYHIDLDFVRFCETVSASTTESKQRRRERRRQRQSMEVLLGLSAAPTWSTHTDIPEFLNEPVKEEIKDKYEEGNLNTGDPLQKAVLDFEDTLKRQRAQAQTDAGSTFYLSPPEPDNGSGAAALSAAALQNIREQMAQSLERMRELEDQVKNVPMLQIQISVLKDENRRLLDKLTQNEKKREAAALESIDLNTFNNNRYHTLPFKSGLEIKSAYLEGRNLLREKEREKGKGRDVGVSCVPLSRDVATEPPLPPLPWAIDTRQETMRHTTDRAAVTEQTLSRPQLCEATTITDLRQDQLYTKGELDSNINKAFKTFERNRLENVFSIGIQVSPPTETLKISETCNVGVQAVEDKRLRSFGINCSVETKNVKVGCQPETREVAVSDDTLDLQCEKCINRTSSAIPTVSLASLSVVRSKSFDYSDRGLLRKARTRSVACGPTIRITGNKSCDTSDLVGRSKDMGVNTVKRKLVDAAVGDSVQKISSVSVCDKCSNAIKTVAKDILNQSRGKLPPMNFVSRIPRPSTLNLSHSHNVTKNSSHSPSPDKPKLTRQDTYTKNLLPTPPPVSGLTGSSLSELYQSKRRGSSSEDGSEDGNIDHSGLNNDHSLYDSPLFQPIQGEPRKKAEPSKEMRAAMKVLNDALLKSPAGHPTHAINIIQQEWFKVSSTASANPLDVEDYLDCLEEMSSRLLENVVNMTDVSGNTAMHYAVSHGNFDVVSILLDSKVCNINQTNAAGYTCVMLVSLAQVRSDTHRHVVRRLFQMADVNIRAKQHGQTALMLAVSHGRLDTVRLLLQCGADVNIQDEDGSTALMCAAEHHHVDIAKLLLAQPDCDLSIRDFDGSTALNIAMEAGNRDIGVLLYAREHFSRGSSPGHRRAKSATPTSPLPPPLPRKQDHSF